MDKPKKQAPPEKQRKTKTKQGLMGLLLNRQKARTCGLA
jgi:hypothetical protein